MCLKTPRLLLFCAAFSCLLTSTAFSARVLLKIKVDNPADHQQTVSVKSYLPQAVEADAIVDLAGLQLGYDIKKAVYYVYKEVELAPKETALYEIELKDLWVIPEQKLDDLQEHAESLKALFRRSQLKSQATELEASIKKRLQQIRKDQGANDIARVDIAKHVDVFNDNANLLREVKSDIVSLENLAISMGHDPARLLRDPEPSKPLERLSPKDADSKTAIIKVTITNSSPTEPRNIPVRYDLPKEIRSVDVVSAGGLKVKTDVKEGICYLYKANITIAPMEAVTFEAVIRDKWNVNENRISHLQSRATEMLAGRKPWTTYKSIMNELRYLTSELKGIADAEAPKTVSEKYVAFYRSQSRQLDRIENLINRVKTAPYNKGGIGTSTPAPTPKTTWLIIYIILGFLAVVSLLVILNSIRK
jgi:hypothetical protein